MNVFLIDTSRDGQPVYDPIVNQSLDNYLINDLRLPGHGLIMYINDSAVIIGRFQNAYAEVNLPYLKNQGIKLVRRSSGGGAVYHDRGNIVFENIVVGDLTNYGDFKAVGEPIAQALRKLGIASAEVRGRNDIAVDGKKCSGMAMVKCGDAYAAGGTILFDLDQTVARQVLTPDRGKLESKGIKSVDARITNIKPYLDDQYQDWTSDDLKDYLLCTLFDVERVEDIPTYHLTDEDWAIIDQRVADHYGQDAWNYGKNPGYQSYVSKHFLIGTIAFNFSLADQKISAIKVFGDFFTTGDPTVIEQALLGCDYDPVSLKQRLSQVDLRANLGQVTVDEIVDLLMEEENAN